MRTQENKKKKKNTRKKFGVGDELWNVSRSRRENVNKIICSIFCYIYKEQKKKRKENENNSIAKVERKR